MDVNERRVKKSAHKIFQDAANSIDLKMALITLSSLVDKPIYEVRKVIEFNSKDGKPKKFAWQDEKSWDGKLWLDPHICRFPCLDKNDRLRSQILNKIKTEEVVIVEDMGKEKFCVMFIPEHNEGCFDCGGTVQRYIQLLKARTL